MNQEFVEIRLLKIVGSILILGGLLANRWVIGRFLTPDGNIESVSVGAIIIAGQISVIALGSGILYFRQYPLTRLVADGVMGVGLTLLSLFLLDRGLGWLDYPAMYIPPLAHPPNFVETFHNIEFTYTIQTNSQGIRYSDIPLGKPQTGRRIVVVGDSFTEGVGVEGDQTFARLLEQHFSTDKNPVEFVNCGLAATWPIHYARILFHLCLQYQPDAVLIALYANDVTETVTSAVPDHIDAVNVKTGVYRVVHTLVPRLYTAIEMALTPKRIVVDGTVPTEIDMLTIITEAAREQGISEAEISAWSARLPAHLVEAVNRGEFNGQLLSAGLLRPDYWTASLDIDDAGAEAQYTVMMAILQETIQRLRTTEIPVGIIYIPSAFEYDATYGEVWRQAGVHTRQEWATGQTALARRLDDWAATQSLPYLDLTLPLRKVVRTNSNAPLYYRLDGHWTVFGHQVAAIEIAAWLETWLSILDTELPEKSKRD